VAAWFGGTKERNPDVGIWVSRLENATASGVEVANAFSPRGKNVCRRGIRSSSSEDTARWALYKVGPSRARGGHGNDITDGGKPGASRALPRDSRPDQKQAGAARRWRLALGSSTEETRKAGSHHFEFTRCRARGRKSGRSARARIRPDSTAPGAFCFTRTVRSRRCVHKAGRDRADMVEDRAKTWSALTAIDRRNPNSGLTDAVNSADGRQLLVYITALIVPVKRRVTVTTRRALSDDGVSWNHVLTLETKPSVAAIRIRGDSNRRRTGPHSNVGSQADQTRVIDQKKL